MRTSSVSRLMIGWIALGLVACSSSHGGATTGAGGGDGAGGSWLASGLAAAQVGATTTSTGAAAGTTSAVTSGAGVGAGVGGGAPIGQVYDGGIFNLGPVDYEESQWHNACAPGTKYNPAIQAVEGSLLAGLWNGIPNVASYCDACIFVTTKKGKSALLRVVTYGDTSQNSIDVSPSAYQILDSGEDPRSMSWQFADCGATGNLMYEFQTGSSEWWTSLWVRNGRVPITKVEVMSANHGSFVELDRGSDGTLTDAAGFGKGDFTFRLTGLDGEVLTEMFTWPADAAGVTGKLMTGTKNFQ